MAGDKPSSPKALWRAARSLFGAFGDYAGWRAVRAGLLVAGAAVLDGAGILLLVPILGIVVAAAEGTPGHGMVERTLGALGATTPVAQLIVLIGAFVAISMIRAVTQFARDVSLARLQTGFIEAERNRAIRALAEAPWERVVGLRHARVTNVLTTEIGRISSASQLMLQAIVLVAILGIQTAIAFALSPSMAAIAAALLLFGGFVFLRTQTVTRDLGGRLVQANQALMGGASSFLAGIKTAAAQAAQASFVAEMKQSQREIVGNTFAFMARQARGRLIFGLVSSVLGAAVVVIGFAVLDIAPAVLITLVLVFGRMSGPALQLYNAGQQFVFALPAFESVRALEAQLGSAVPPVPVAPPEGAIELDGASLVHPGGRGIREVTLRIEPGSFVGIAGPSGAGKTTLVDLIVGLTRPQTGTVRVGGEVLDDARRAGWAGRIGYVSQEGFLFNDTLRRNLCWANGEPDDAEIAAALEFAGAGEIVARLEHGLETMVGERGTSLSGGERQRFGLARVLLRKPRLIVLDEAANALDAASEAALLDRLATLSPRPTILMISHREASLAWCDRVIRVEDGRVTG